MTALDQEFCTVKQLAAILQVNPMTIYRIVERGELVSYEIGRAMRFRKDDIEAYLQKCRVAREEKKE